MSCSIVSHVSGVYVFLIGVSRVAQFSNLLLTATKFLLQSSVEVVNTHTHTHTHDASI